MLPDRFDMLRSEALEEIARLAEEVYVPGAWYCPKCGFELVCSVLYAQSGNIGVDRKHPDPCPNDGMRLQPGTWKRDAMKMAERMPDALCMRLINELRDSEGASVTICCDNADFNGLPNCCIEVIDDWTDWDPQTLRADTLIGALSTAVALRGAWHQAHEG